MCVLLDLTYIHVTQTEQVVSLESKQQHQQEMLQALQMDLQVRSRCRVYQYRPTYNVVIIFE